MFKWLSKIFIKKECHKCTDLLDKMNCIKKHLLIDPYGDTYRGLKLEFVNNNIAEAIRELKVLKNNLSNNIHDVRKINSNEIKDMTISKWFTDDDYNIIENTDKMWLEWLSLNIWLVDWYEKNNKPSKGRLFSVSIKIKPYIINIVNVVDTLIIHQKEELI